MAFSQEVKSCRISGMMKVWYSLYKMFLSVGQTPDNSARSSETLMKWKRTLSKHTLLIVNSLNMETHTHTSVQSLDSEMHWHWDIFKHDLTQITERSHKCSFSNNNRTFNQSYLVFKGIVHFEIHFWYVLAYLKGIQDVGVFVSTVVSI